MAAEKNNTMKIELSRKYAEVVLRSLKDREEGLEDDLQYYKGCNIGAAIADELAQLRTVKDYIEERLLAQ